MNAQRPEPGQVWVESGRRWPRRVKVVEVTPGTTRGPMVRIKPIEGGRGSAKVLDNFLREFVYESEGRS